MREKAHGNNKAQAMANQSRRDPPRWGDASGDDSGWWKSIPARSPEAQAGLAKVFHVWVRAYLVSLEANARVPGVDGDGTRRVLETMDTAENRDANGYIKMGAVVESFAQCLGDVVYHALCLLNWAGHVCAHSTLENMGYSITAAVVAYRSGRSARRKEVDATRKRDACILFEENKVQLRTFVMQLKCGGNFSPLKPTPLTQADLQQCAEAADCGAVTILYGRIIAYLKFLHGCRNNVFSE
eukprot:jgi/Ulvmu1/4701/UM002_0432.1